MKLAILPALAVAALLASAPVEAGGKGGWGGSSGGWGGSSGGWGGSSGGTGSSGGSSSGGSSSGGGHTDVPAPSVALLFGLAAAGVMLGRRRNK